jgi:hypothetical protein
MYCVCKRMEGSKSTLISHESTKSTEFTDLNIYAMENAKSTFSWYEIVDHFSSLKSVFSKDRLPAIAVVTPNIQDARGENQRYLAGL